MKQRSTYVLLGVFVALAVVAYFLLRSPGERAASYSLSHIDLALDSAKVHSIVITKQSSEISLQNIGGTWYLTKTDPDRRYRADEHSVRRILGSAQNLKVLSLVSSNPDKQHLFEVDSTGTLISFTDRSGKTISYYVGKMGPSFSEVYVRAVGSNDVLLAEGITSWDVNKDLKDWRDKVIVNIVRDSVRQLTFRYPKDLFSLLRDPQSDEAPSSVWKMQPASREGISETHVANVLNSVDNLRADDFVDSAVYIPSPQLTLDLKAPEPISLSFTPIPPDSSKYWVTSSTSPQIFLVNKWNVQPMLKQRRDFLESAK